MAVVFNILGIAVMDGNVTSKIDNSANEKKLSPVAHEHTTPLKLQSYFKHDKQHIMIKLLVLITEFVFLSSAFYTVITTKP